MNIQRMVTIIIACTLFSSVMGGAIGFGLGKFAPDYYRVVFSSAGPSFDPVSVGVGLGVSQGALGGMVVGLGLAALCSWRELRQARASPTQAVIRAVVETGTQPGTSFGWQWNAWKVLRIAVYTLALILCLFVGWLAGLVVGTTGAYHRQYLHERQAMLSVLADDPAFRRIEILELSSGGMYLLGEVAPADLPRMRELTIQAVGRSRADEALYSFSNY